MIPELISTSPLPNLKDIMVNIPHQGIALHGTSSDLYGRFIREKGFRVSGKSIFNHGSYPHDLHYFYISSMGKFENTDANLKSYEASLRDSFAAGLRHSEESVSKPILVIFVPNTPERDRLPYEPEIKLTEGQPIHCKTRNVSDIRILGAIDFATNEQHPTIVDPIKTLDDFINFLKSS